MSQLADFTRKTAPSIKLDGQLIDEFLAADLLEMRIARGTRTTGRASLTFVDRTSKLARSVLKLGASLSISSIEPDQLIFEGVVTAVGSEVDADGLRATITAHDATHALTRARSVETFAKQSPEDAIKQIAREARLSATTPSSGLKNEWFWRADSLLGQVDELCERLGWEWVLEGKKNLRCIDVAGFEVPAATATLEFGVELMRFAAEQSKPVSTEVEVRGWDTANKTTVKALASTPAESKGFKAAGAGQTSTAKSLVTRSAVSTTREATSMAKAVAASSATVTARGRAYFSPLVQPGHGVTIKGAGASDGDYYVREVEHVYDGGMLRTSFVAGFRAPTLVSDPWLAARSGSSIFGSGVHSAIVTNIKDDEKLGRVRVKLPSASEEHELGWARVVAPGGGKSRGLHWMPEVNDEVLVAFEDGDVRRPVVVGGLYNATDLPPGDKNDPPGEKRTLVSRAGHKIEFSDKEDFIDLVLSKGGVRLHLGTDRVDLETKDKPLRIASGNDEIVFDGQGTITISAQKIVLKSKTDLELEGTNVKAKAGATASLEGQMTTIKAGASLKLQSSGIAELGGSVVKIN